MSGKGRCEKHHHEDYGWVHWLCFACGCGAPIDIWTAYHLEGHKVFWHVEHDGECLVERAANLETNEFFEAGCLTGDIVKALSDHDYYSPLCGVKGGYPK